MNNVVPNPPNPYQPADTNSEADEPQCAICLDILTDKKVVIITGCNHMFDRECLHTWLKAHATCPICRKPLNDRIAAPEPDMTRVISDQQMELWSMVGHMMGELDPENRHYISLSNTHP